MAKIDADDFTVGWVTAIPVEQAAAEQILDEEYDRDRLHPPCTGRFTLGRIGRHNVVIGSPPAGAYGPGAAAAVATRMQFVFKRVQIRLLVGIAGGVPVNTLDLDSADVRLGDVVVSQPSHGRGGVIAYDLGKERQGGIIERTGFINAPPNDLLDAVAAVKVRIFRQTSTIWNHLSTFDDLPAYTRDRAGDDVLFSADSEHVAGPTCESCERILVERPARQTMQPLVHYGTIASGSLVIKDGKSRDSRNRELGGNVLCFEMEAAGVILNDFPCLVIRGISDYADSHKNDSWQPYASATAAAYAKEVLLAIPSTSPETRSSWTQRCIISPRRNSAFVGRDTILTKVSAYTKPSSLRPHRRIALVGLGGVGKTQIALEYAYQARDDGRSVFWVDASDLDTLEHGYKAIAAQVVPQSDQNESSARAVSMWLSDAVSGEWLLVLDNVNDTFVNDASLLDALPRNKNGSILLTSRNYDVAVQTTSGHGMIIPIDSLTPVEALQLLRTEVVVPDAEEDEAKDLVQALDCLPIGISQATTYMNHEAVSIRRYCQLLERSDDDQARLLDFTHGRQQGQISVLRVWRATFEHLQATKPAAFALLKIVSMCRPKEIPSSLLRYGHDQQDFEKASQSLVDSGIFLKSGSMFAMHQTVHFALRKWLGGCQNMDGLAKDAIRLMANLTPDGTYDTWPRCNELLPHAECVLEHVKDTDAVEHLIISRGMGQYLREKGRYKESEVMLKIAHEAGCRLLGAEHEKTLDVMSSLASTKSCQHRSVEASELQIRHREICLRVYGPEHPKTLMSVQNLSEIYLESDLNSDTAKADELLKPLIEQCRRVFGQEHKDTLNSVSMFARCLLQAGKFEEAGPLLGETSEKIHNLLGEDHPWLLSNAECFSMLYVVAGQYGDAENLLVELIEKSKKVLGDEHPITLRRLGGLAKIYFIQKRNTEAESLLLKLIESCTRVLGEEHQTTIANLQCLWKLHETLDRLDEAKKYAVKTINMKSKTLGDQDSSTLECCSDLVELLITRSRLVQGDERREQLIDALFYALKTEDGWEKSTTEGKLHPNTLKIQAQLSVICNGLGRHQDAIEYMEQAVRGLEVTAGRSSEAYSRCSQLLNDLRKRKAAKTSSDCVLM